MAEELTIGFLPLVDGCLPILARAHGFAEDEGVSLNLVKDVSWATVLDRLLYGHSDAAHMVAPLAIATTLGRGRPAQPLSVPFVLGLNGNAITLRSEIAQRVGAAGQLGDPAKVGAALAEVVRERKAAGNPLRFGVVHRYSSHNYMLRYWLAACGIRPDQDVEIATVPGVVHVRDSKDTTRAALAGAGLEAGWRLASAGRVVDGGTSPGGGGGM